MINNEITITPTSRTSALSDSIIIDWQLAITPVVFLLIGFLAAVDEE
jgi:hypothetical protein